MPLPRPAALALGLAMAAAPMQAAADAAVEALAARVRAEAASLAADPVLLEALRAANRAHAGLDAAAIARLDAQWRGEAADGGGPLIAGLLDAPASARLRARKDRAAGIADLFVFDLRGMNVAQSWVTHDYWQGDEPQFLNTVPRGPGAANVESAEPANPLYDGPVRAASASMVDPGSGAVIGGLTVVFRLAASGADMPAD